ncbi:uncharacterized protein LOC102629866 isoform X1 [Citrus sinensis]|uniref:Uncharacterized protein n=2 Tax=Citrus sinensis TaxID=2711 RepID=A0A067DDD7_CITSI|nr:uncharacterized protein LOC102629866 isoform X1 [Citrus sinensis]KDO40848.1 hypothetical protein CISIN_1g027122mg [Citrus sinensis]
MGSVPVHLSASFPVKVSGHRKLTGYKKGYRLGYMASAPPSVKASASASFPLKTSDSASQSDLMKVSGNRRLKDFKSDYLFIRYSDPDEMKRYGRMDFGLFGRSWLANASWTFVFAPGVQEYNWKDYLPTEKSDFMDTGHLLRVVASGSSNGLLFAVDADGFHERAVHGFRTMIPLDELRTDSDLSAGGSLILQIDLLATNEDSGEVRADTDYTFDGQTYWNLYLNRIV